MQYYYLKQMDRHITAHFSVRNRYKLVVSTLLDIMDLIVTILLLLCTDGQRA